MKKGQIFKYVLVAVASIIVWSFISQMAGTLEKTMDIKTDDGMTTVYYQEFGTFKGYVKALNKIAYNDEYSLVGSYQPDVILYKDKDDVECMQAIGDSNEYVEFMNYLLYNDDCTVDYEKMPHIIMYQKLDVQ